MLPLPHAGEGWGEGVTNKTLDFCWDVGNLFLSGEEVIMAKFLESPSLHV